MKKILFVNDRYDLGGVQKIVSVVGKQLTDEYDVLYYSWYRTDNFYEINQEKILISSLNNNKLNFFIGRVIRFSKRKLFGSYSHLNNMKGVITELVSLINSKNIDIVIMNSGFFSTLIPEIKKWVNKKVKFIGWMHNSYDVYLNVYFKSFKGEYIKGLEYADYLVCLTQADKANFLQHNKNTEVIYNPINLDKYVEQQSNLNKKEISFAARLNYPHKGIDYLKEIAHKIPNDWIIKIAGGGSNKEMLYFLSDFKELIKSGKVQFYGSLKEKELIDFYKNSSLFISTSRWEGFGLVITEAMACGLPVIAFDNQGPAEILTNKWCLVEKFNVDEFVKKINAVIENPEFRNKLANENLERVNDFEIDLVIKQWNNILDNITKMNLTD